MSTTKTCSTEVTINRTEETPHNTKSKTSHTSWLELCLFFRLMTVTTTENTTKESNYYNNSRRG